jgi:1-acyl-sn-glycerol-3-phosphate acyltransferase
MRLCYDLDNLDNRDPALIAKFHRLFMGILRWYFRAEVRGLERIPQGAGLFVGNHSGGMLTVDSFIFGAAVYEKYGIDEAPYGLGHEVAISIPFFHHLLMPLGAVRADHKNAHRLFERGNKVLVYPGGDLDALRSYWDRNRVIFGSRRGYIRLALRANVPIIPVVSSGAHESFMILTDGKWLARLLRMDRLFRAEVCPIALSIPWGLTSGFLPYFPLRKRILIEILEPIYFEHTGEEAASDLNYVEQCHHRVHSAMQSTLEKLTAEREKS